MRLSSRLPAATRLRPALIALACVLSFALTGLPRALASVIVAGPLPCAIGCDDDTRRDEHGHDDARTDGPADTHDDDECFCSPLCSAGACGKATPTLPAVGPDEASRPLSMNVDGSIPGREACAIPVDPVLVFHPPRH